MIYMLEDDDSIRNYVLYALNQSAGMQAKGFEKPSAFWKAVKEELPKVILLDIMLPEERKDNLGLGRSPGESSEALLTRLGSPVCWGEDRSEEWAQVVSLSWLLRIMQQ